jgi:release factor glutamine methyltransferase
MNKSLIDLVTHHAHELSLKTHERPEASIQLIWWMLEALTHNSKTQLLLNKTIPNEHICKNLELWINRYINEHMPIQYLIGSVPFIKSTILVEPPILIPRPETEAWVYDLCSLLSAYRHYNLTIADIGTGSGCIAIALAQFFPNAQIYALDCDPQALELTRKNCILNNITNITTLHSDVLNAVEKIQFDIIISNPPYIPEHEYVLLEPRVRTWEAHHALTADDNGLAVISKIIIQAYKLTHQQKSLYPAIPRLILEIGYNQGASVSTLMSNAGFKNVICLLDYDNNDRVVYGY